MQILFFCSRIYLMALFKDFAKTIISAFVFAFLACFAAASAYASPVVDDVQMTPGPARKAYCPHCQAVKLIATIASGNTIGARMWSDMKREAPMLPHASYVQKCEACSKYFTLAVWADYETEPEYAEGGSHGTWGNLTFAEWKETVDQFEAAGEYTNEDEKTSVYINFLQTYNDEFFRGHEPKEPAEADKALFIKYVDKLLGIMPIEDVGADASVMLLEFYREAGQWDKVAELQPTVDQKVAGKNKSFQAVYKQFTDRIQARDTKLFEVEF